MILSGFDPEEVQSNFLDYVNDFNDDVVDDADKVSIFDYELAVEEVKDVNEEITDYQTARAYLGGKPNLQFKVAQQADTMTTTVPTLEDVTRLVQSLNPSHVQALQALNELFTIAQAWNKADNFMPDYSNRNQDKWFPWFVYDADAAGFVSANTYGAPSYTYASLGSRLCFKTANRARQFGKQFIDLWNKVLMF
ncbi:MAG: hypothetical protein NC110_00070 [Ruminococcus sp.]|nr:hypothetical protein [Ruminococcus sp.]